MAFEITIRYEGQVAASGRLEPGENRLDLVLPPLPGRDVQGSLEVRASDEGPAAAVSASCISEWLRCGEAVLLGEGMTAPLAFSSGSILGSLDRPWESTLHLTYGARLLRLVLRIPSLVPAGETAPPPVAPAPDELPSAPAAPAAPDSPATYGLEPPAPEPQPAAAPPPPNMAPPGYAPSPSPPAAPGAFPTAIPPAPATGGYSAAPAPYPVAPAPYPAAPAPWTGGGAYPGAVCRNHPDLPTSRVCDSCRNPFCDQCLVELRGAHLCAWCKQAALVQMQRAASVDPRSVVTWARIYDIVVSLGAGAMGAWQLYAAMDASRMSMLQGLGWLYALGLIAPLVTLLMAVPPIFNLRPGRRWAYGWQTFILIPTMLLSCLWASCLGFLFWAAAIVLLVYWVKPEVRDYFEQPS